MSANDFLVKLKADGSEKDWLDLEDVFKQYQTLFCKLTTEDRGTFAVNVLCILCRNIEKVPSWPSSVDLKALLSLAIECMRCARCVNNGLRVKTLACTYHLHKCVVKQTTQQLPPELILKLSYMPFESTTENLLKEYCKTYWNLLADSLFYIEKLKSQNMAIHKLFPKLSEDVLKVVEIYETVAFSSSVLTFLVTKLHVLYSEILTKELNKVFGKIFQSLSQKSDVSDFKKLSQDQCLDLYGKFNDCLYIMAENSSKTNFQDSILSEAVRNCVSILGHNVEILHCYQTLFSNTFCMILTVKIDTNFTQTVLSSVQISCDNIKKIGYEKTLKATIPALNQLLKLYIDYFITNKNVQNWCKNFNAKTQEICMKLMRYIIDEIKSCKQSVKCENCKVKSGLHDALSTSFCIKNLITISLENNIDVTPLLPIFYSIVQDQYSILKQLCSLGCRNYEKCYKKLQSDIHNTAILLNKYKKYEFSIKLFDIYIRDEIQHFKSEIDFKNISRALYNKSICELDCKLHENALKDAYLSMVFNQQLSTDKHMSLVMDIKAKALKAQNQESEKNENDSKVQNEKNSKEIVENTRDVNENDRNSNSKNLNDENRNDEQVKNDIDEKPNDALQLMTVLEACKASLLDNRYGNLKPFFCNLKFSVLLKHEFTSLTKLWPSIVPIAGVWRSLFHLLREDIPWLKTTDDSLRQTLYDIILETTSAVRTVHNDYYCQIVKELVEELDNTSPKTLEQKTVYASLLFLQSEYDISAAGIKYGWKVELNNDSCQINRTMEQEHIAVSSALRGLVVWMDLNRKLDTIKISPTLINAVHIACVFVPILLQLNKMVEGLQLAHICCRTATLIGDKISYLRNASSIIHLISSVSEQTYDMIDTSKLYVTELIQDKDGTEAALVFLCELSMYYARTGQIGVSARLIQVCQARLLDTCQNTPDVKVDVAIGKLSEAQSLLCTDDERTNAQTMLSASKAAHRHYVGMPRNGASCTWSARRYISTTVKHLGTASGVAVCARAKAASLLRRVRQAALTAQMDAAAADSVKIAALTANTHITDEAQVKIDNRLKYILGLPNNDQIYSETIESKSEPVFTPKQDIETMLENMTFKKTLLSPSIPPKVPGFKTPEFLTHGIKCMCCICQNPPCFSLICQTYGLEASMYFRAKEFDIAKNYFDGCVKCFSFAESKLKRAIKYYRDVYESYLVDAVEKILWDDLRFVQIQVLIENAFFELSQNNDREVDEKIVTIHEILQEYKDVDLYLRNEVLNLLIATAKLRKQVKKLPEIDSLEIEMEQLKLSPIPNSVCPKTPEMKPKNPPKITKHIVSEEEIPNTRRKVIKLNLDDDSDEKDKEKEVPKRSSRRTNMNIPVLVVPKPELEMITPKPKSRLKTTKSLDENVCNNSQDLPTPRTKKNATKNTDISDSFDDFATPKPKNKTKIPVTDINVANLERTTQKTRRTLSKQRTLDTDLERNTSLLEKTSLNLKPETSILDFATPKSKTNDDTNFFTPKDTPGDQFFTPMTSLKTYTKKSSLRAGIIKNLEKEFSMPKIAINDSEITSDFDFTAPSASKSRTRKLAQISTPKILINGSEISNSPITEASASKTRPETIETGSIRSLKDNRSLKRAASPGKLEKSEKKKPGPKPERISRLRKPVRFSIESPDKDAQ